MFDKLDYCDEKYPLKYETSQKIHEILKNTKHLIKNTKKYFNFSSKYFKMTTKSSFKVPEITHYPILKNSEMSAITRQSYDFKSENMKDHYNIQEYTYPTVNLGDINKLSNPLQIEEKVVK